MSKWKAARWTSGSLAALATVLGARESLLPVVEAMTLLQFRVFWVLLIVTGLLVLATAVFVYLEDRVKQDEHGKLCEDFALLMKTANAEEAGNRIELSPDGEDHPELLHPVNRLCEHFGYRLPGKAQ